MIPLGVVWLLSGLAFAFRELMMLPQGGVTTGESRLDSSIGISKPGIFV